MIQAIEIQGFRGIREGSLTDLTPLVVLVGPNGSGKSTVLEAMLVGASPLTGDALAQVVHRHEPGGSNPGWLFWKARDSVPAQIGIHAQGSQPRVCKLWLDRSQPADQSLLMCQTIADGQVVSEGDVQTIKSIYHSHHSGAFAPLDDVLEVRLVEGYANSWQRPHPEDYLGTGAAPPEQARPSTFHKSLSDLYTMAVRNGKREEITDILAKVAPGLTGVEILTENSVPFVYLVYGKDGAVPASLSGDGIESLVRLSLELAASGGGLALLEEPEVHQHPAAMRQSAKVIVAAVRRGIQVVLTTHSLELIDSLLSASSPEDVEKLSLYSVVLQNGIMKYSRLAGPQVQFARSQIEDDLR